MSSIKQVAPHQRLSRLGMVIDVQQDFMLPHGRLPVPGAYGLVPNLQRALLWMRENTQGVVFTADWHSFRDPEISDNPDMKTTFPPHCMGDESWPLTFGAYILPELDLVPDYMMATMVADADEADAQGFVSDFMALRVGQIRKTQFDVFAGNPMTSHVLDEILEPGASIYLCGVATDVCVRLAVAGLVQRGYKVHVFIDCIKGLEIIPTAEQLDAFVAAGVDLITLP